MQRCGFMFSQEVPNDPEGYRYVWHSNHRGRIMLERVRLPEGRDAWLFSRGTLRNLDALVEGHRDKAPDPRYATIGVVIGDDVLAVGEDAKVPAPPGVPKELGSPRKALRTFLESMDELEFDADQSEILLACLDLGAIPPEDQAGIGLRLAAKLEAILRRLAVDLLTVADTWEADPLVLGRDTEWQVTLARGRDGGWRFDRETVSRVPDMFERLTPDEKSARERRSNFHSAQQTMRTLLHASDAGDLALAARCLDLDGVPQGARANWGRSWHASSSSSWTGSAGLPWKRSHRRPMARGTIIIAAPWAASTWRGAPKESASATGCSRAKPWPRSRRCSA